MPPGQVLFEEDGVAYGEGDFVACNPSPGVGSLPYIGEVPALQHALPRAPRRVAHSRRALAAAHPRGVSGPPAGCLSAD